KVAGAPNEAGLEKIRRGLSISTERRFQRRPENSAADKSRSLDSGGEFAREFASSARDDRNKKKVVGGVKATSRVKTAPAKVRLVREGDNPWYELTLMEGKNRQIRKMFEEIG